jgi:hypothetical protein
MRIVTVNVDSFLPDVAHREDVELLLANTTCCVDREQNRPRDAAAQEAQDNHHLEEAHEEVTVDRLVVQDVLILEILEVFNPSKQAPTLGWSLPLDPQMVKVRPGRIDSAEGLAEDNEGREEGRGKDCCRYKRRQERRQTIRRVSGLASLSTLL